MQGYMQDTKIQENTTSKKEYENLTIDAKYVENYKLSGKQLKIIILWNVVHYKRTRNDSSQSQ